MNGRAFSPNKRQKLLPAGIPEADVLFHPVPTWVVRAGISFSGIGGLMAGVPHHRGGEKPHERHRELSALGHAAPKRNLLNQCPTSAHRICYSGVSL
jgi:hypothetical protein